MMSSTHKGIRAIQWTKCTDRLPAESGRVLILCHSGFVGYADFDKQTGEFLNIAGQPMHNIDCWRELPKRVKYGEV